MAKMHGSWSGMRKYLEQKMLASSLKGRVRYDCTCFRGMDGCHIFRVYIDNNPVKCFSLETVNTYFIKNGYKNNIDSCCDNYWEDFWELLDKYSIYERVEYTDAEFCDALEYYRSHDIKSSLNSLNPLIRMLAILDRRIGKRTLDNLKDEIKQQPMWLQQFYNLRISTAD